MKKKTIKGKLLNKQMNDQLETQSGSEEGEEVLDSSDYADISEEEDSEEEMGNLNDENDV